MKSHLILPASLISLLLLAASCEKEIDINYHSASPQYVVEAKISQEQTQVLISTTQGVTDNSRDHGVEDATVVITSGDSIRRTLQHRTDGRYTTNFIGQPGTTYQLSVEVGGRHFTSTSTMQSRPQVNSFRFVWMKTMGQRILFGDLRLQDQPAMANYYFMHLYRNGIGYRWAVMTDKGNPGRELQQLFTLMREGTHDTDALREGDRLHLVIRAIDRSAYDYLFSMQAMESSGTNPVSNFTGGCLGYFSAYYEVTRDVTFHFSNVEEE